MPALTIKGIPDELLDVLRRSAEANHRSLNAEVIHRLQQSVPRKLDTDELLRRAAAVRELMPDVYLTEQDLRKAKDEGRP